MFLAFFLGLSLKSEEVGNCGNPPLCLCTSRPWLVFCDGPNIAFLPHFSTERLNCDILVIQNTAVRTLSGLNLKQWPVLRELHVSGNNRIDCVKERAFLSNQCRELNIDLKMQCTPTTTTGTTQGSSNTTVKHHTTPSTTAQQFSSIHQTEGSTDNQTKGESTQSTQTAAGSTTTPHVNLSRTVTLILFLSSTVFIIVLAIIIFIVIRIYCKRKHRVPTIIYNDTNNIYTLTTETSI